MIRITIWCGILNMLLSTASFGLTFWLDDITPNGNPGTGTESDPYKVGGGINSTAFDDKMLQLSQIGNCLIRLKPGEYWTRSQRVDMPLWALSNNIQIIGAGVTPDQVVIKRYNLADYATITEVINGTTYVREKNDCSYVITGAVNATVRIENLTIDCNWNPSFSRTSCGAMNIRGASTIRNVVVKGVSGNTDFSTFVASPSPGSAEMYAIRVSAESSPGVWNRSAPLLVEDCVVTIVKGGYISGINAGAGTGYVRNNTIKLPVWTETESDNPYDGSRGINLTTCNGVIVTDNYVEGGRTGIYSDYREMDDVDVSYNTLTNCTTGIQIYRNNNPVGWTIDGLSIYNNTIHLSKHRTWTVDPVTGQPTSDFSTGIYVYGIPDYCVSNVDVYNNIIKGGDTWNVNGTTTWSMKIHGVANVDCHDNWAHDLGTAQLPMSYYHSTLSSGSLFYDLFDQNNNEIHESNPAGIPWLTP